MPAQPSLGAWCVLGNSIRLFCVYSYVCVYSCVFTAAVCVQLKKPRKGGSTGFLAITISVGGLTSASRRNPRPVSRREPFERKSHTALSRKCRIGCTAKFSTGTGRPSYLTKVTSGPCYQLVRFGLPIA